MIPCFSGAFQKTFFQRLLWPQKNTEPTNPGTLQKKTHESPGSKSGLKTQPYEIQRTRVCPTIHLSTEQRNSEFEESDPIPIRVIRVYKMWKKFQGPGDNPRHNPLHTCMYACMYVCIYLYIIHILYADHQTLILQFCCAKELSEATASGKADVTHPTAKFSNRNGPSMSSSCNWKADHVQRFSTIISTSKMIQKTSLYMIHASTC